MTKEVIHRHMATHTTPLIISQYAETSDPAPNRSEETLQVRYIRPSQKYTLPPPPSSQYISVRTEHTHLSFPWKGAARQICCRRSLCPITQHPPRSLPIPSLTTAAPFVGWPKPPGPSLPSLPAPGATLAFTSRWLPASPLSPRALSAVTPFSPITEPLYPPLGPNASHFCPWSSLLSIRNGPLTASQLNELMRGYLKY